MKRLLFILAVLAVCMAPVVTISEPSAGDQQKALYNSSKMARTGRPVQLEPDEKWVLVLVRLHPDVVQPIDDPVEGGQGDYPALGKQMVAIPGVMDVTKVTDGHCPATILLPDHSLQFLGSAHVRIHANPEPPPE